MAIFRQGVKIGPFDIRAGISRGDLAKSAYHKTAQDVRLKQRANTENTIGRFRAMMAKAEGYARSARFAVRIFPPANLKKIALERKPLEGSPGDPGSHTRSITNPEANTMYQLFTQMGQQINIHCDSVSMPGHDLQTQSVQWGSSPARDIVQSHGFAGTINASFYADKYLRERHFFEMWQKMSVNTVTHKANYYDSYIGKMHIFQLGSDNLVDVPTYGIEAVEVYPATISAVEYAYGSSNQLVKINVGFNYKEWHNLAESAIVGTEYGATQQTLHDVKSVDRGLFGKLPPELQRAGRDIANIAKTQLPIGRLTKGKIFPPFT